MTRRGAAPPPRPARSTGFLLAWVAAEAGRVFAAALDGLDLDAHSVGVLEILAGGPVKQARLSEQLGLFKPQMVPLVNGLQERGLVERRPHPTDRRAVLVAILPPGRDLLAAANTAGERATEEYFAPLTARQRAELHRFLSLLAHGSAGTGDGP